MKRSFLINFAIGFFVWAAFAVMGLILMAISGGTISDRPVFYILLASISVVALIMAPMNRHLQICPRSLVLLVAAIQGYVGMAVLTIVNTADGQALDWNRILMEPVGVLIYTLPYCLAIAGLAVWIFARRFREA